WVLILVGYLSLVYTILTLTIWSNEETMYSNIATRCSSLNDAFDEVSSMGLTGENLITYFQNNSKSILSDKMFYQEHQVNEKVNDSTKLYEILRYYLFNSSVSNNCSLENSIPAKLTKNVKPIPVHSHNDYWRDFPLFEGLAVGATSTEADVWIIKNKLPKDTDLVNEWDAYTLAVGHSKHGLKPEIDNLESLYTGPLLELLDSVNCNDTSDKNSEPRGVFYDYPNTTVFLHIDFKSKDSKLVYDILMNKYLQPLIQKDYVTYYDMENSEIKWKPVTVVLTGASPNSLSIIDGNDLEKGYFHDNKRYGFPESVLDDLDSTDNGFSLATSTSFSKLLKDCKSSVSKVKTQGKLSDDQISCIKRFVDDAHGKNLKTRIWDVPEGPDTFTKEVWTQEIHQLGIDLLNVDDLFEASKLF
ncbi:hypothetical protein Kpol_1014p44, partial [Vanderwaltozyma polyspora DSM 70294]